MHTNKTFLPLAVLFAMTLGCSAPSSSGIHKAYHVGLLEERSDLTSSTVVTVHAASGTELDGVPLTLPNLLQWTMDNHPRLAQAGFAIEAAKGRALQAGLYPNPKLELRADEVADRTGPEGIITAPDVSQEIVTGGKLELSRSAALREVDQASLGLLLERSTRITAVRQGYFEVLALQRRVEILEELIRLSEETVRASKKLLDAQQIAKAELIQLEIEFERTRAERDAARSELPAAFRKLAAQVGVPRLPERTVLGSIEELPPEYDLTAVREQILAVHPEIRSAQVGIDKALLLLRRAEAEARPNVTVGANFVRQGQNDSNDFGVNVSLPLPLWNRNEGSIQAAQAQLGEAHRQVARVENELTERLANSFATYTAARQRAQRYRDAILPKARESHQLTLRAFQAGQFESLKVLQSQKAIAEANLEYNRASGDLWRSASEIAGLLLEEAWPTSLATAPKIEE